MALQGEAIDLTLSDEDDVESPVTQHQTQQLQMPIKCESNVAAAGNNNSIARSHDEDEGLKPATTGEVSYFANMLRNLSAIRKQYPNEPMFLCSTTHTVYDIKAG